MVGGTCGFYVGCNLAGAVWVAYVQELAAARVVCWMQRYACVPDMARAVPVPCPTRTEPSAAKCAEGRSLRFLANVDPIDVARALTGLDPETTLVVVISKTFTTAETMLNARTVRSWLVAQLGEWVWWAAGGDGGGRVVVQWMAAINP